MVPLRRTVCFALALALAPAALTAACSSDENAAPSGPSVFDPPGGGVGGSGGAAGSPAGGSAGAPSACLDPTGCFSASCAPQANGDFLNRCTDAQCARFDNAARLPRLAGGALPPLP